MSDAQTFLISRLLFPLQERIKGHTTTAVRRALEATQWWSPDRLAKLQLDRLRTLVAHAEKHVPYYRDTFTRLGFSSADLYSEADVSRLPLLTKPLIRANLDGLKSDRAQGLARFNTGGSSGEPLVFFIGPERISHDVAAKWRATRWWGVDIGDPEIVVWGSPIELGAQDRVRSLRDRLMRTELLPAFEMSDARLDSFVERIRRRRPRMLFGYPSALSLIARHAEKRAVALDSLGIKVAFVTAETLHPAQREVIVRAFGCRVANGYGGRDAGFIAHECQAGGMHITAEDIIVETVDAKGRPSTRGTPGEIVVTHLATSDFPFIRYRTGDIGIIDDRQCDCGRGLPLIREIQGRMTDFLVAEDHTIMHGLAAIYPIRDLSDVAEFMVIQESVARTRVMVVPGAGFGPQTVQKIVQGLKSRLGPRVEIVVDVVPQIPRGKSGKHRYVVSEVAV